MAESRKLAAILAADVAGYSKLTGETRSGRSPVYVLSAAICLILPSLCITAASLSGRAMAS